MRVGRLVGTLLGCVAVVCGFAFATEEPIRAAAICSVPFHAGAYDQAQWAAISKVLIEEFGWHVTPVEGVPFPKLAEVGRDLALAGYDVIIYTSSGHIAAWHEVAPEFPDTWFWLISQVEDLPDSPRVVGLDIDAFNAGVIVGIAMAKLSQAGHIGVVGGYPILALLHMFSGIFAGAQYVNPNISARVTWIGTWEDIPKAYEGAKTLIAEGADVLFDISGWGYRGTISACEEAGIKFVGYALDQSHESPVVVISHAWDLEHVYRKLATELMAGTLERQIYRCPPSYTYLIPAPNRLPPELEAEIMELMKKVWAGEITLPRVILTATELSEGIGPRYR